MKRGINIKVLIAVIVISVLVIAGGIAAFVLGGSSHKLAKHLSVANKYLNEEEYKDAIAEFEKALEIDEKCVEAYLGISEAYVGLAEEAEDKDKPDKALKYYEKALKILEKGLDATDDDDIDDEIEDVEKLIEKIKGHTSEAAPAAEAAVEEAAPAAEYVEEAPAEEVPAEEDYGWVQAYISYLKSSGYSEEAALIYVDNDDIPELVLSDGVEAGGCRILTYHAGNIDILQTNRLNFVYVPYSGILDNSDGHMDYYYDYIYEIRNGKWESIAVGEYEGYIDGDEYILTYFWNGDEVSEDEYTDNVNNFCDSYSAVGYYELCEDGAFVSLQEMADILNSYF